MIRSLIILGTGGSSYDILDIVEALNSESPTWVVAGFLDDAKPVGSIHLKFPVLGGLRDAAGFSDALFINAIGSDVSFRRRRDIVQSSGVTPDRFATLVHPQASVSPWTRLGRGVYVSHGASLAGGVTIGDHVSFCPGCIVGHDSVIEDFSLLAPAAVVSGFVNIGASAYLGAGSLIRQRVRIGEGALVGMGAVVIRNVPAGATVVGNPARELTRKPAP